MVTIFLPLELFLSCSSRQDVQNNNPKITANSLSDSSNLNEITAAFERGRHLFKEHCNKCHIAPEKNVTDQFIFDNLFERLPHPPEDYFIKYVQDSKFLKSLGDKYSQKVSEVWNSDYEHYFRDSLSQQDFDDMIIYIKDDMIIYIKIAAKRKYQK